MVRRRRVSFVGLTLTGHGNLSEEKAHGLCRWQCMNISTAQFQIWWVGWLLGFIMLMSIITNIHSLEDLESNTILIEYVCAQMTHYYPLLSFKLDKGRDHDEDWWCFSPSRDWSRWRIYFSGQWLFVADVHVLVDLLLLIIMGLIIWRIYCLRKVVWCCWCLDHCWISMFMFLSSYSSSWDWSGWRTCFLGAVVSDTGLSGQKHSARKNVQLIQVFGLYYHRGTFAPVYICTCVFIHIVCASVWFCMFVWVCILNCLFTARTLHQNKIATQIPEQTPLTWGQVQ